MAHQKENFAAPLTLSQTSRKGKKAWRKNIDISPLEQGLEDLQSAQIAYGTALPEKPGEELFVTDVVGDPELLKKQRLDKKPLRAEEILAVRSAIPGLEGRKKKRKVTEVVAESDEKKKKLKNSSYVSHRELQRLRSAADGDRDSTRVQENDADYDPWAESKFTSNPQLDFLEDSAMRKTKTKEPKTLKQPPQSLAANGKRIPSVPIPNAGKSYNPLVGDWSELLEREGTAAVETEILRLQSEAEVADKEARAAAEAAQVEAAERKEEIEGYGTDFDSAWESEWDGILSGNEEGGGFVWTQKQKGRKTQAERNKIKARKEREAKEVHEKKLREREKQEQKIGKIAKEVSAGDIAKRAHVRALASQTDDSDSDNGYGEAAQLKKQRFGKVAIPEPALEVVLPEELQDSLRRLKPEGNLMLDRYRSLLINGKMEARKRVVQRKQVKKMRSEKWSYKDWKLK